MRSIRLLVLVALSFGPSACEYGDDMALPTSREETATPANPVSSNTINAIQDAIVGAKHTSLTLWMLPTGGAIYAGSGVVAASGSAINVPSGTSALFGLQVFEGTRITGAKIRLKGPGSNTGLYNHVNISIAQSATPLLVAYYDHLDNLDATYQTITMTNDAGAPHTLAAGESVYLDVDPETNGFMISAVGLIIDRL